MPDWRLMRDPIGVKKGGRSDGDGLPGGRGGTRVSVAEIMPRGQEFERTPPHDLAAEQCVLGGMMLSKDAISDVLEVIRAHDYYRPAHQIIHDIILDLYGRGEPADAVTVAAELTRNGDIGRMGGAPYLHTLIASVPTAANAGLLRAHRPRAGDPAAPGRGRDPHRAARLCR